MSNLFKAGSARRKSGGFSVSCSGGAELVKRLKKLENGGEVAIKRTTSDFVTRAPGWVSKGIREHYGVDTAAIKDAATKPKRGKTTIKVAGLKVDDVTLEYKGRTLTPLHFKMSPKKRPPKPYTVKATILKGERVSLPSGTFIGTIETEDSSVTLPFQRKGKSRKPIEVVHTLSVPQMTDGRAHDTIKEIINTNLGKRFQHHIERVMK